MNEKEMKLIKIDPEKHQKLKVLALHEGKSLQKYIDTLLTRFLKGKEARESK